MSILYKSATKKYNTIVKRWPRRMIVSLFMATFFIYLNQSLDYKHIKYSSSADANEHIVLPNME